MKGCLAHQRVLTKSMAMLAIPTKVAGRAIVAALEVLRTTTLEVVVMFRYGTGVSEGGGGGRGGGGAANTCGIVSLTRTACHAKQS